MFINSAYADKLLKSGFINKKIKILSNQNIDNPENKIVIIYNHGQNKHDAPIKNECAWLNNLNNSASLIGKKIKDKEIMVYNFCTIILLEMIIKEFGIRKSLNHPTKV